MQQDVINQTNTRFNFSFHQTGIALSLVMTLGAAIYYFVNVWAMQPAAVADNIIPPGYDTLVLNTLKVFVFAQAMQYILLTISAGSAVAATSHEKAASQKAARNAYGVLTFGSFAAVASFFWGELIPFYTIDLIITSFALSEIVKFVSQLYYIRR